MNSSDPLDELHSAIERNNVEQLEHLIAIGVVPEIRSLFFAIRCNANEIVRALIKTRTNVDDLEPYWRQTPLTRAVECKNLEALKILLEAGASPTKACRFGPPLIAAATKCFLEGAQSLIAAGADLEQRSSPAQMTPLIVAARMGHLEMVKLLLAAGANPLSVDVLDRTAYDIAVEEKKEAVAKLLAPVSFGKVQRQKSQLELLLDAIKSQDAAAFQKCLATGPNVNKRDRWGWNPLDRAVDVGSVDFVKKLLKAGAKVNAHKEGVTALEIAVNQGRLDIAEILLKAGALPEAATQNGRDPFWNLCILGNVHLAKLFLEAGANPNSANRTGETALMNAVGTHRSVQLVELLISHGAEIECADSDGCTALFHAVRSNPPVKFVERKFPSGARLIAAKPLKHAPEDQRLLKIVRCLLNHGADVRHQDNNDRTPLTYATTPGVAQLLTQAGAKLDICDKQGHDVCYWLKRNGIPMAGNTPSRSSTAASQSPKPPLGGRPLKRRH